MKIGQLIKLERQKQNMKQTELAQDICSPSYLSKIENGTAIPGDDVQQILLRRLNISLETAIVNSSSEHFSRFSKRFKEVVTRRDKHAADLLCQELHSFLVANPLHQYKISLLLMEARLMLMSPTNFMDVKTKIPNLVAIQCDMSHTQLFHLYIIQGIIAYIENRFTNALHIFTDAHKLTREYRMGNWEIAECHYVLSLAALSDRRYILAIDHVQKALTYFNAKMQAKRSIECMLVLGISQKHIGNVEDALIIFKNAKEIGESSNVSNYFGITEQNLGACYSLLQDSEHALHHFNQGLIINNNPDDQVINILSITKELEKTGNIEAARHWVNKGIVLLNRLTKQNKNSYSHHFAIYKALLYDESELVSIFESALHYFQSKQNYSLCFIYCHILAKTLAEKNKFKLATTYYQQAFDYHLQHRKVQHWGELL